MGRLALFGVVIPALAATAISCGDSSKGTALPTTTPTTRQTNSTAAGGTGATGPRSGQRPTAFKRVVVVVFENKSAGQILGNAQAPTFNHYARRGAVLAQYFGVAHPSLPNYLALVSGSTHGITSDCTECIVN